MALIRKFEDDQQLVLHRSVDNSIEKKQVLEENFFVSELDRIIERDFFPDLAALKQELAYEEALKNRDYEKLRQLQIAQQQQQLRNIVSDSFYTPRFIEQNGADNYDLRSENSELKRNSDNGQEDDKSNIISSNVSLDEFLSKYTSEDNASFSQIMEDARKRHRSKYAWMYGNEEQERQQVYDMVRLPSIEMQAKESEESGKSKKRPLIMWPYRTKSALMFNPDGASYTQQELIKLGSSKRQQIMFENTRFKNLPFNEKQGQEAIAEAAHQQAKAKQRRFDVDGRQICIDDQIRVNGYELVPSTPLLEPGVEATPLMTWGEIEGTPMNLDQGDMTPMKTPDVRLTPSSHRFKIPEISSREKLAISLTDKVAKNNRDKKRLAVEHIRSQCTPTSSSSLFKSCTPSTPKLSDMSPAAQLLAKKTLGLSRFDTSLGGNGSPYGSFRSFGSIRDGKTPTPVTPITPVVPSNVSSTVQGGRSRHKASEFF